MDHRAHLYCGFAPISNDQSIRSTLIYCAFTTAIWLIRGDQPWEIAVMLSATFYCAVYAINVLTISSIKIESNIERGKKKRKERKEYHAFFSEDIVDEAKNKMKAEYKSLVQWTSYGVIKRYAKSSIIIPLARGHSVIKWFTRKQIGQYLRWTGRFHDLDNALRIFCIADAGIRLRSSINEVNNKLCMTQLWPFIIAYTPCGARIIDIGCSCDGFVEKLTRKTCLFDRARRVSDGREK